MGTRSLTYVYESFKDRNEAVLCMYRQFDGYMEGHGADLAEFLNSLSLVNGLGSETQKVANGMGCLAAQLVAHFKTEAGNFYLHAPTIGRSDGQEYEYHVFNDKVIVYKNNYPLDTVIFEGTWKAFAQFCKVSNAIDIDARDSVKDHLQNGEVLIEFTKKDGTLRKMRVTTKPTLVPEEQRPTGTRVPSPDVQTVFDLDENHWKSFRWDSLIAAKVA